MSREKAIIDELKRLLENGTDYRAILKQSMELSKLDQKFQRFFVDAKTLIHLGRDSIKDHTTALLELVKNSYDADANNVEIEINCKSKPNIIRVADNGFGMTKNQLVDSWLRIGFSSKRQSKVSFLGRRKTGEKGIGRISTDRLGACLELKSKTVEDGLVGLKVNWDDFNVEGKEVFEINIEITKPSSINIPLKKGEESETGTEIIITRLRQEWTEYNIDSLHNELSTLTPPFNQTSDFSVDLYTDVTEKYSGKINSTFFEIAEIDVTAIFDGSNQVYYSIRDKYSQTDIVDTISLEQFFTRVNAHENENNILACGPLTVRLLFFLREQASVFGTDFKLADLREFLDNNAGVKIYRDKIAVRPYGFPNAQLGYDWLGLGMQKLKNPAGIGRGSDFTVSPNQLVGAVFIERDTNLELNDSAAREGLVESKAFYDMKQFILATKRLLESHRARLFSQVEKKNVEKKKIPAHREVERIKDELHDVNSELATIAKEIEENDAAKPVAFLKPLKKSINKVEHISSEVEGTITELLNWQRTLNGLATIGISSAVFGHETETSITQFQGSTNTALRLLRLQPPSIDIAVNEIDKALKASKRVAAWGAYALTRVQKEKRRPKNIQVFKTVENVLMELRPAFEASSIKLNLKGENLYSKTYQMDIETVLVNLLTNAFTAASSKGGDRKVVVTVKREDQGNLKGYFISVADSGPGVAKEFEHRIFEPLFSTKTIGVNESKSVGTGMGLTIVKSIVEELEGNVSFSRDAVLNGANFKVWLPKL